ncbi:MAG: multicopper oxidase domain-containing protein [Verrucomicrobiales bacterium]
MKRPAVFALHLFALGCALRLLPSAYGETVTYDLTIARETMNFTGKERPAITINGGIPGPVVEFTEGDLAVLHVHNELDVPTSIHWHGMLLPSDMDGVPFISFPPIEPMTTFTYRFPIRQTGTYWYHSHSELQEEKGHYGVIVIHPKKPRYRVDHDVPVMFSDWTDESTHEVAKTLRRGSEWYSIKKGSAISLLEAANYGMLDQYFQREMMRMPEMDISDVWYPSFLVNGREEMFIDAKPGEVVRLRLVDGAASTFFYGEFARGPMTIVSADGQAVEPVKHDRLLVGVAETYDVLLTVPPDGGAWEFRCTAHDASGHASIWIGDRDGERHHAPDVPVPNLYYSMGRPTLEKIFALTPAGSMGMPDRKVDAGTFDTPGMTMNMDMEEMMKGKSTAERKRMMKTMGGGMKEKNAINSGLAGEPPHEEKPRPGMGMSLPSETGAMDGMDHGEGRHGDGQMPTMNMSPRIGGPVEGTHFKNGREMVVDALNPKRPLPPYPKLRAVHSTAPDPSKPVREIRLTLDGDMDRFVWLLNNKPLSASDQIYIRKGEVVRFVMINRTMMYHPMHLHGQFFRVINGQGDRSPLKHTVTVTPMATTVFEFEANEVGDWFFHCHLLYHMHNGMARVVHYESFTPDPETQAVRHKIYQPEIYSYGFADLMSHMTEGEMEVTSVRHSAMVSWEIGWGEVEETEYEIDVTANYFHDRFLSLFAGVQLTNEHIYPDGRAIFGYRYPIPFLIETFGWVDSEGEFRFGAEKAYPITDRLHAFGEVEYDTRGGWEWSAGLEFMAAKHFSLIGNYHSEFGAGGGLSVRF